jgi:CBS domain-containing protein
MTQASSPHRFLGLRAEDILQANVITVSYAAPVSEVEQLLSENRIGGVPVTGPAGNIIGVVSIRDLVDRYVEDPDSRPRRGRGFFHLAGTEGEEEFDSFDLPSEAEDTAESIMTATVYSVKSSATLQEVAACMVQHGIHRVLVTEAGGERYVGVITSMGLLAALAA